MSSVSITGKKWFLKKFDPEKITFFKDNYFIDDFTAKLLAIKKIENSEIKNFLNPSIKNILPNPNVLKDMVKATKRTVKSIIKKEKTIIEAIENNVSIKDIIDNFKSF